MQTATGFEGKVLDKQSEGISRLFYYSNIRTRRARGLFHAHTVFHCAETVIFPIN